ncbi:hypothetical protein [Thermoflexus sp.]|uniref:hypothetical protein n=1 Tax=Thermoflexus sp. TaxID=1969742 RepID=UPI002ADDADF1|nr:hypothetical protein [Thermoflexus sp.]
MIRMTNITKRLLKGLAVILLAAAGGPFSIAIAQVPGPGAGYNSGFTIQNMSSSPASCLFTIYDQNGSSIYTSSSISIAANGSYFVYVGGLSIPSGAYSVQISCDQPVVAIANTTSSAGNAASYEGFDSSGISSTLYTPGLYKNYYGYTSNVTVQNASNSPITVTLEIYPLGSSTPVATPRITSLAPNASKFFDLSAISIPSGAYSGRILADGPVAAVVNIWHSNGEQFAYDAIVSGSTTVYAPVLMKSYYGFNTALTVQNTQGSSGVITITYSSGLVVTATIPAYGSILRYTPNENLPSGWLGSAKIESNVQIIGLVNEADNQRRAGSYVVFSNATATAFAPIVLKNYYGFSTSITCQNLGSTSATLRVTYSNGHVQTSAPVPPNGTVLFYQPNVTGLPNGFNGSATITTVGSGNQPIACIVNQNKVGDPSLADWLLVYSAFNR